MNFNERSNQYYYKISRSILAIALVSVLTGGMYSITSQMVRALDLGSLGGYNGFTGAALGNICFASDCTNQNIQDNQNSPVVTDSDNTNIESGDGGIGSGNNPSPQTNAIDSCFAANAVINPEYFQAVQNFKNALASNSELARIAAKVGTGPIQNTDDLWNLLTDSNATRGDQDDVEQAIMDILAVSGFSSQQQSSIMTCITTALSLNGN